MALTIYHYPNCSTCKAALRFLLEHGVPFKAVDISKNPPSRAELRKMAELRGAIKPLFNTSGKSYREGGFSEKLRDMSLNQSIEALHSDGMLVKRPFVLWGTVGLLGFREDEWRALVS